MLPLIICALALVGVCIVVTLMVRERRTERWERRAEEARVDGMVRRAQLQLNGLARNAFQEMLDIAREHQAEERSSS